MSTAFSAAAVSAQAPFVNFEVGAVSPITTSKVQIGKATRHLLLVCNVPDNRLEIYDAESPYALLARVPTGLAPVTVRVRRSSDDVVYAYTCNHIGDSVTTVRIAATGVAANGRALLRARMVHTKNVGDEPSDIAFVGDGAQAVVSLRSRSAVAILDAATMDVIPGHERHLIERDAGPFQVALKHPGSLASAGDRLFVLDRSSDGDRLDLFVADSPVPTGNPLLEATASRFITGNLGTTRHSMVLDSSGTKAFIVGMRARSEVVDEPALAALATGFAQSWLWVVDAPVGTLPGVRPEPVPGIPAGSMPSINLNRDYAQAGLVGVATADALAQPTGVAILEDDAGNVTAVVVTAFSSDRVAILTPDPSAASGWDITRVALTFASGPQSGYSLVGPRGVTVNPELKAPGASQLGVVFVANGLDNSVAVLDPHSASVVAQFQLANDPTPAVVRAGREFLYGAHLSGNGTVSCSSCHIDGHTDGIAWDLSTPGVPGPMILDSMVDKPLTLVGSLFPGEKGPMMTQTLRGLVNHRIDGAGQSLATNAPYHWRGDRATLQDFNGAFAGLLGGSELAAADIDLFTDFVETIPHPPNPEQVRTRTIDGDLGQPISGTTGPYLETGDGDGVARGMKLYLTEPSVATLSCVHCHSMPDGSNNRITESLDVHEFMGLPVENALETAALRHIFDREALVVVDNSLPPPAATGGSFAQTDVRAKLNGLFHHPERTQSAGAFGRSINQFTGNRFVNFMPGATQTEREEQVEDLISFVRALDTGTAPVIGMSAQLAASGPPSGTIALMLAQAGEANCGVVVWVGLNGATQAYWLDVAGGGVYRSATTTATATFASLQALVGPTTTVEFQAVPVGSERVVAAGASNLAPLTGSAPSNVSVQPMTFPTHWARAGHFFANWDPNYAHLPLVGGLRSHFILLDMQKALVGALPTADFGVHDFRHELPRRMRVAGDGIRHGATLRVGMPSSTTGTQFVDLPIFPTDHFEGGARIWETTVEFDGEITLALLNGGPFLAHVQAVRDFVVGGPPLDPANDNSYTFEVVNQDGTTSGVLTDSLRVSYDR